MKYFLNIFFALMLSNLAIGQVTITLKTNPSIASVPSDTDEVVAKLNVKNNSNSPKTFNWQRVINQMTNGWEALTCDKEQCHGATVTKSSFDLAPGEENRLDMHIRPNNKAGNAIIDVIITESGNSTNTAVAKYYFNATPTSVRDLDKSNIRIAPNPVQDIFSLIDDNELVEEISIYNLIGRQMKVYRSVESGQRFNIGDLPDGIYLVRLFSRNGNTLKTLRLNKTRIRA
jgi:Secretion system C-terminal sorting domain